MRSSRCLGNRKVDAGKERRLPRIHEPGQPPGRVTQALPKRGRTGGGRRVAEFRRMLLGRQRSGGSDLEMFPYDRIRRRPGGQNTRPDPVHRPAKSGGKPRIPGSELHPCTRARACYLRRYNVAPGLAGMRRLHSRCRQALQYRCHGLATPSISSRMSANSHLLAFPLPEVDTRCVIRSSQADAADAQTLLAGGPWRAAVRVTGSSSDVSVPLAAYSDDPDGECPLRLRSCGSATEGSLPWALSDFLAK